jgi:hypothetical protein
MTPSKSTKLARGKITRAHEVVVTLEEPEGAPPAILIHWPNQPTVTTPHQLPATVAKTMNVLARASVRLTHIRRERKL